MSEDFTNTHLAGLAHITMGQSPGSDRYNKEEHGLPFLQGCAEFGPRHPEPEIYCYPPLRIAKQGSVLISVRAPVGTMNMADQDYCIGRGLGAIDGISGIADTSFLRYAIEQNADFLHRRSQGSTFLAIGSDDLRRLPLPKLDIKIQERISEVLEAVDAAIEKTESLIAKYQQIKAGLMHDLFTRGVTADGKLRPPREQAPELYQETPIGWIPKEWELRKVGDLGEVITGNTPPEHAFTGDSRGIPFVTPGDVGGPIFVSETVRSVSHDMIGMARLIGPNAICVVCIGSTIGKLAMVSRKSITNQQINSVLCATAELSFFAYFSMSYFLPMQLQREAGLQAVPIVKKSIFERLRVAWPTCSEEALVIQKNLLGIAGNLESEEMFVRKLRQQKHGLMHDLLTGKVHVPIETRTKEATHV
jgi:type I restriction enzyme S subunit